jgi:hypothetical protein
MNFALCRASKEGTTSSRPLPGCQTPKDTEENLHTIAQVQSAFTSLFDMVPI